MTITEERVGDWMQLASGRRFYPFDPRPEEIHIEDIAHALSHLCRFGGHCRTFYSVAEHSVRVSKACAPEDALWGLLHDASEAYLCDLPRPIKRNTGLRAYREVEEVVQDVILTRFGLLEEAPSGFLLWPRFTFPESVHHADEILLATEARDLMGNACLERWSSLDGVKPLPTVILPWAPAVAKQEFLTRFRALTEAL